MFPNVFLNYSMVPSNSDAGDCLTGLMRGVWHSALFTLTCSTALHLPTRHIFNCHGNHTVTLITLTLILLDLNMGAAAAVLLVRHWFITPNRHVLLRPSSKFCEQWTATSLMAYNSSINQRCDTRSCSRY